MNSLKFISSLELYHLLYVLSFGMFIFPFVVWLISLSVGNIEPIWPFISDLGTLPPEASIFSLFMNCGWILELMFVLIRFKTSDHFIEFNEHLSDDLKPELRLWNSRSLKSGLLATIGTLVVANFRVTEMMATHALGANLLFFSVGFDIYFQSKTALLLSDHRTSRLRLFLSLSVLFLTVISQAIGIWSMQINPLVENLKYRLMWNCSQDGYYLHIISSFGEWLLIWCLSIYYLTFVKAFKMFSLKQQLFEYKD